MGYTSRNETSISAFLILFCQWPLPPGRAKARATVEAHDAVPSCELVRVAQLPGLVERRIAQCEVDAKRDDVLIPPLPVDYWDYLGGKDPNGAWQNPRIAKARLCRQVFRLRGPYTPQTPANNGAFRAMSRQQAGQSSRRSSVSSAAGPSPAHLAPRARKSRTDGVAVDRSSPYFL